MDLANYVRRTLFVLMILSGLVIAIGGAQPSQAMTTSAAVNDCPSTTDMNMRLNVGNGAQVSLLERQGANWYFPCEWGLFSAGQVIYLPKGAVFVYNYIAPQGVPEGPSVEIFIGHDQFFGPMKNQSGTLYAFSPQQLQWGTICGFAQQLEAYAISRGEHFYSETTTMPECLGWPNHYTPKHKVQD